MAIAPAAGGDVAVDERNAEPGARLLWGGDPGSGPAAAVEEPGLRQLAQGAADGRPGAAQFRGKFGLRRQEVARTPDAGADPPEDIVPDPLPGRARRAAQSRPRSRASTAR